MMLDWSLFSHKWFLHPIIVNIPVGESYHWPPSWRRTRCRVCRFCVCSCMQPLSDALGNRLLLSVSVSFKDESVTCVSHSAADGWDPVAMEGAALTSRNQSRSTCFLFLFPITKQTGNTPDASERSCQVIRPKIESLICDSWDKGQNGFKFCKTKNNVIIP